MHQIDRSVRLEQVAPGALAGMRLARHQEHAQLVAHAVDRQNRAVVDLRQLVVERGGVDLHDVLALVRDRHRDLDVGVHRDHALLQHLAVAPHDHLGGADMGALVLDAEADGLRLADDAEARRLGQHHPPVDLVGMAGDQRVHRRGKAERARLGRHVVHAPVGDHDGAGHAVGRHVGERRRQGREQPRALVAAVGLAGVGFAHFQAFDAIEPRQQQLLDLFGLLGAVAELLARALVDDDGGDRGDRVAVLARERWVGERQYEQAERDRPHPGAAAAREQKQDRHQHGRAEGRPHRVLGHQRSK